MNTRTRPSTDTAVILMLPAASATPYRLATDSLPASVREYFSGVRLSHQARLDWLAEAEKLAVQAQGLITLHVGAEPPAWFRACPGHLQNRLAAWRSDRLIQRSFCCHDLAEALLAGYWLQQKSSGDGLDARIAAWRQQHLQRMRWQPSVLPWLWTVHARHGTRLLSPGSLRRRMPGHAGNLGVILQNDGGYWLTALDGAAPARLQSGSSCCLQAPD